MKDIARLAYIIAQKPTKPLSRFKTLKRSNRKTVMMIEDEDDIMEFGELITQFFGINFLPIDAKNILNHIYKLFNQSLTEKEPIALVIEYPLDHLEISFIKPLSKKCIAITKEIEKNYPQAIVIKNDIVSLKFARLIEGSFFSETTDKWLNHYEREIDGLILMLTLNANPSYCRYLSTMFYDYATLLAPFKECRKIYDLLVKLPDIFLEKSCEQKLIDLSNCGFLLHQWRLCLAKGNREEIETIERNLTEILS